MTSVAQLLNLYCTGPLDPLLTNPFPEGTEVLSVYITGNVTILTMADPFSELTGLDLALACAALHRTTSGITGTPMVQIGCQTAKVDGKSHITITENTILYLDSVPPATKEGATEE